MSHPGAAPSRVALFSFYFSPSVGGIQRYVYELLQACPSIVFAVAPAMPRAETEIPRGEAPSGASPATIPVLRLPCLHSAATASPRAYKLLFPLVNALVVFGLFAKLFPRRREFDLLLSGSGDFAPPVALVARLLGKPFATVVHGKDVLPGRRGPLAWYKRRVLAGTLRRARAVFANSRFTADYCLSVGVSPDRLRVLHPIVDASNLSPEPAPRLAPEIEARAARARLRLITAARLIERKGTAEILRAMADLPPGEREAVFLFVAGDGPERPRLERLRDESGLTDRVAFLGEIPMTGRIMPHYRLADVCVLPSKVLPGDVETFGMVFVEAALYGLPSIGTRSGGIADAVADGETGLLVEPGEAGIPELAEAIGRFLREPELAKTMGERARARAEATFNRDRCRAIFESATR